MTLVDINDVVHGLGDHEPKVWRPILGETQIAETWCCLNVGWYVVSDAPVTCLLCLALQLDKVHRGA